MYPYQGNPYQKGMISTVDLLVETSSNALPSIQFLTKQAIFMRGSNVMGLPFSKDSLIYLQQGG
jgi:hypothetical protein